MRVVRALRRNSKIIQKFWRRSFQVGISYPQKPIHTRNISKYALKYALSEQVLPLQKQWEIADAERQKKDLQLLVRKNIIVVNEINEKIKQHNTQRRLKFRHEQSAVDFFWDWFGV
jgi:hypothetical protein